MGPSEKSERYRWTILITVYQSMLAFTLLFQSLPPILPLIVLKLHLTYAQSGLSMSLFALPGIFVSLLGGFLSDRYGMRPLGTSCFLLMIAGTLLVGLGRDIHILLSGRIIAGIGAFTLSILLPKLISQWFKDRELGLAMGIFNTAVPLGSVICFGLFGKMGSLWGWRVPILLTGAYSLIASIFFLRYYQVPSSQKMEKDKPLGFHSNSRLVGMNVFRHRSEDVTPHGSLGRLLGAMGLHKSLQEIGFPIWGVGLSWLWFNAGMVSFSTFAPDLFLQKGYTIEQSGLLIGIPPLGSLFLSTPTGYLIDRFRHHGWLIGIGGVGLSLLTFCFNFSSSYLMIVVLMGVFSGIIPSPIYSFVPAILRPKNMGLGFGIISTCSCIGIFLGPYLVGKTKDLTGSNHWGFILISFFFLLTTAFILLTHHVRKP